MNGAGLRMMSYTPPLMPKVYTIKETANQRYLLRMVRSTAPYRRYQNHGVKKYREKGDEVGVFKKPGWWKPAHRSAVCNEGWGKYQGARYCEQ